MPTFISRSAGAMEARIRETTTSYQRLVWRYSKRVQRKRHPQRRVGPLNDPITALIVRDLPVEVVMAITTAVSRQSQTWDAKTLAAKAREALTRRPSLKDDLLNPEHSTTLWAQRLCLEWQVLLWLREQSRKGLAIRSPLLVENYLARWPHGPPVRERRGT